MSAVIEVRPSQSTFIDRSGAITTGGVSQLVAAANTDRRYLLIFNPSRTESMWVNFTVDATQDQPSIEIPPLSSYELEGGMVTTEAIYVIAATTGHKFVCKEAI